MKKIFLSICAVISAWGSYAQGINFSELSFDEALKKGANEGKYIFLDCYTSWCGPCMMMAEQVFPLKQAGDYFNSRFVNLKIDMEKGEGVELAKRYHVKGYPTFLILNSKGEVIHSESGSWPVGYFIHRIDAGITAKKSIGQLTSEYQSGKINKKDLTIYWLLSDYTQRDEIENKLMGMLSKSDHFKSVYWPLVIKNMKSPLDKTMDFVLKNRKKLERNLYVEEIDAEIYQQFQRALLSMLHGPTSEYNEIVNRNCSITYQGQDGINALIALVESKNSNDVKTYIETLTANYANLKPIVLLMAFQHVSKLADSSPQPKKYYAQLSALCDEIALNQKTELGMKIRSKFYKRMSMEGVCWEEYDLLADAIAQSKLERRNIFIFCYNSQSGSCEDIINRVFAQENIGDLLNRNFINIKLNMSNEIAKKYDIKVCPTILVVNPEGVVLQMITGDIDSNTLFNRLKMD